MIKKSKKSSKPRDVWKWLKENCKMSEKEKLAAQKAEQRAEQKALKHPESRLFDDLIGEINFFWFTAFVLIIPLMIGVATIYGGSSGYESFKNNSIGNLSEVASRSAGTVFDIVHKDIVNNTPTKILGITIYKSSWIWLYGALITIILCTIYSISHIIDYIKRKIKNHEDKKKSKQSNNKKNRKA